MILIGIYKEIYEVTKFISKHPGEGINSTYLSHYKYKECTEEFEKYHFTLKIKDNRFKIYVNSIEQ